MLKLVGLVLAWAGISEPQLAYASARRILGGWALAAMLTTTAVGQVADNQLQVMGLQAMWRAQLQMPLQDGKIVSVHLWTNPNVKKVYAELVLPVGTGLSNRTLRTPARLAKDGTTWLIDEAKKDVEMRAARVLGRAAGIPAVEVSVPLINLVIVTSDGIVQTFDAETGDKLWQNSCGPVTHPAAPAAVGDLGVVVDQGDTLYLLDWKTGKHLQRRKLERATSTGVSLVGTVAFSSSHSGQIQGFDLSKAGLPPYTFRLYGRCVSPPATSDRAHHLAAFATNNGSVTLLSAGPKVEPWFNVVAPEPVAGPLSFIGGYLYVGGVGGQFTKLGLDRVGNIQWRMMIGGALASPPMVIGQTVYVTNEIGQLQAGDDKTGAVIWPEATPKVKAILAGSQERLHCRSLTDRLLVIDAHSGKILHQTGDSCIGYSVVNHLNDRLYLISDGGLLQCARPLGQQYIQPVFHEPLPTPTRKPENKPADASASSDDTATETSTEASPFGSDGSNPAGAGDNQDPFAPSSDGL